MEERIKEEFAVILEVYPKAGRKDRWIWVPDHSLPEGWSLSSTPVAFFIRDGYPGISPYGIYVRSGLRFKDAMPSNFTDPAPTEPPFEGKWAMFSWEADNWKPAADPRGGHNFVTWVYGFATRFNQGI